MPKTLKQGDIVRVSLPSHQPRGHEQEGKRPVIVVGVPKGDVRYPVLLVVPLTTQIGQWANNNPRLYPQLKSGLGGLSQTSVALLDQVRSVDARRVISYLGSLTTEEYKPVQGRLQQILGF